MEGGEKMKRKGFTLIELVVVMALIAVLSLMVIGAVIAARRMTTETKHRNNGKAIQVGMEKYYASNRYYPKGLTNVTFKSLETTLGITLDSTASDGPDCTTGGPADGGGKVTTPANGAGFTVEPYNYNCTAALGDQYTAPN